MKLNNKLVQCLLYVFGYASIIASVIASGYILIKDKDEDNRRAAKNALVIAAIFTGLSAIAYFYYQFVRMSGSYGTAYDIYVYADSIINIVRIVVFAVFAILALVGIQCNLIKSNQATSQATVQKVESENNEETNVEENAVETTDYKPFATEEQNPTQNQKEDNEDNKLF